jgi:hypothetical protein
MTDFIERDASVRRAGDPRDTTSTWTLVPPPPGTCSQCADDHEPEEPHNFTHLYYKYAFYAEHRRWPTWEDALAHCDDEIYEAWRSALAEHGVEVKPR